MEEALIGRRVFGGEEEKKMRGAGLPVEKGRKEGKERQSVQFVAGRGKGKKRDELLLLPLPTRVPTYLMYLCAEVRIISTWAPSKAPVVVGTQ